MVDTPDSALARLAREREKVEFKERRSQRSRRGWPWDEIGVGAMTAFLGWLFGATDDKLAQAIVAFLLGALGAVLWHYLKVLRRWAFSVPVEMHLESYGEIQRLLGKQKVYLASIDGLNEQLKQQELAHKAAIEAERQQNQGVALNCGRIDFRIDKDKDEISVIASIQWLQNRNTYPVRIEVALFVPLGIARFSTTASLAPMKDAPLELPLLPPQVYLNAKDGVGPGYWVFTFTHRYLTGFLSPFPKASFDEIVDKVHQSEMYFQLRDLASEARPIEIDAPGTLVKRAKRGGGIERRPGS